MINAMSNLGRTIVDNRAALFGPIGAYVVGRLGGQTVCKSTKKSQRDALEETKSTIWFQNLVIGSACSLEVSEKYPALRKPLLGITLFISAMNLHTIYFLHPQQRQDSSRFETASVTIATYSRKVVHASLLARYMIYHPYSTLAGFGISCAKATIGLSDATAKLVKKIDRCCMTVAFLGLVVSA